MRHEPARAKTGIIVTAKFMSRSFHAIIYKQHLHRYLSEFDFRYNSRKVTASDRREAALKALAGKRLMLHDPIAKKES